MAVPVPTQGGAEPRGPKPSGLGYGTGAAASLVPLQIQGGSANGARAELT